MIGDIEAAIVARLDAASSSGALGYRLREVESYGGQLDEETLAVVRRFPAAWVTYGGDRSEPQRIGTNDWKILPSFNVIVAARNYRNERASRRGDSGEVGSYQILQDVRRLLTGSDLGLDIEALAPGQALSLFGGLAQGQRMSVFALPFHTAYAQLLTAADADLDDFALLHADWDIPVHGDHETVPLEEGDADATDNIEPETV